MKIQTNTLFAALLVLSGGYAFAQNAFTPGNLVIDRVGSSSTPSGTANGTPIYLDQYTTAGVFVNSNAIPSSGASELVDAGNSTLEGQLTTSPDGTKLVLAGYNVAAGASGVAAATSANDPRAVATVDYNGNYSFGVADPYALNGESIRAGTTDGNGDFWAVGAGVGVFYMASGTSNNISTTEVNNRQIQYIGGNLYYSTGSGTGIWKINGTPTTGPNTAAKILTESGSPYGFSFDPLMDTCYIADADAFSSYSTIGGGGIEKFTWNGASWVYQYSLSPPPGDNNSVYFLAVDWTTMPPTIYGLTTNLYKVQDIGTNAVAISIATNLVNETFRGLSFAPSSGGLPASAPDITGITPSGLVTNNGGSTVTLVLSGSTGVPLASNNWYKISNGVTNVISGADMTSLALTNLDPADQAGYFAIITNASGSATSGVVSLTVISTPAISSISPTSVITNAGQLVTFSLSSSPGYPSASNLWYKVTDGVTTLISNGSQSSGSVVYGATTTTLTISNVLGGDTASYFAELTNIYGTATSAVATLAVVNDPLIQVQPNDTYGLVDGQVQFAVVASGTTPISYQWYFTDPSGDIIAPVADGNDFNNQSLVYGSQTSLLTITNVQYADVTNFVVVISNIYGAQTSSVASLLDVTNVDSLGGPAPYATGAIPLAFWDFNGSNFIDVSTNPNCIYNPVPYLGVGTALAVGSCYDPTTSPFSGSVDGDDGMGFDDIIPGVYHDLDYSWGTDNYPASGGNKQNGVQFNVSTVGAKNIYLAYQSRVSATASDYERVQYTTNGTVWVDYPSSLSFKGVGTTYEPYSADFSGFPGVANNPDFGVRIVTECEGTATYGITGNSSNYLGTANTYGTSGTVTYDLVGIYGDAITNNNVPPVISAFTNAITQQVITNATFETTLDTIPITNVFTVSGDANPAQFTYSAVSLNSPSVNPTFAINVNANGSGTLVITPNIVQGANAAAGPILFSVTDANGDVTRSWFDLTLVSANPSPTNTLTAISETNTLVNTALTIPFVVGSVSNAIGQLTYTTSSDNNNVVPGANIAIGNQGAANPTLTLTPGSNQLGVAIVTVTVNDNNQIEPKNTTANIPFIVRPDTNIIDIDYFNYDNSGSLDQIAAGFWNHLSGNFGQMQLVSDQSGGYVTVDTLNNTENLQTPLLGAPYSTNGPLGTLYYSFVVNMPSANNMPNANGTYIAALNDGTLETADVEDLFMVCTNDAAPGNYRIGIGNNGGDIATSATAAIFPQDLVLNSNYVIVTALNLQTGQSTVWLNPSNSSSPSVTAPVNGGTIAYNISDFELRESGGESGDLAGAVNVSYVKIGTTFGSVLQTPQIANNVTYTVPFGAVWDIPGTNLESAAGWSDPNNLILSLVSAGPTSLDGTNVTTDGVNIYYGGAVVSDDSFNYVISDGYMTASGLVSLKPILQINGSQTINGSGHPIITGSSPVGAANYVYGVEDRTNLLTGPWVEAGNVTVQSNGAWSFTDPNHTNPPVIFYRLYYPDQPSNPPQ